MISEGDTFDVVIGVDGGLRTWEALRWAADEAAMRHGGLTLIHVAEHPLRAPDTAFADRLDDGDPLRTPAARRGAQHLKEASRIVGYTTAHGRPLDVRTELVFGRPESVLVELSKRTQLMVVGPGRGSADTPRPLGRVSSGVVHRAHCPVAVVREAAAAGRIARRPVLVGVDGSPVSELALQVAFDEASQRDVDITALHAWSDSEVHDVPTLEWSALQNRGSEILAERLAGWQERYPDITVHRSVVWDSPAEHLLDASRLAQLVVVGSHGRGMVAGKLLGSVSTALVNKSRVPVIVARPR
jgi:nucleotide-binding universal stress UspA family protein